MEDLNNIKVKVRNNSESIEAQNIMCKLLGRSDSHFIEGIETPTYIGLDKFSNFCWGESTCKNLKEITLPELRDLVVLKRNNREDANVIDHEYDASLYLDSKGDLFVFHLPTQKWKESNLNGEEDVMARLKPIEKPMKEYLIKSGDGKYLLTHHDSIGAIEIPEGATYYAKDASLGKSGNFFFRLRSDDFDFEAVWLESNWMQASFNVKNQDVLWQRDNNQTIASAVESSQPEELPFIDDECYTNKSDGGFRLPKDEPCDMSKWSELRGESLNDQYAEIEKVRQSHRTASETSNPTIKETLNQRQSQYGSFEDVAQTTEQLFQVIKGGASFVDFTESQRMALYMIFSKVARLSNGDCNHKDSWHDIAGYATLIDNELESEKDMPF